MDILLESPCTAAAAAVSQRPKSDLSLAAFCRDHPIPKGAPISLDLLLDRDGHACVKSL